MSSTNLSPVLDADALWLDEAIEQAVARVRKIDAGIVDFPHITEDKKWTFTADGVWTGGFWAGLLWLSYEHDGDRRSLERAVHFTDRLLARADDTNNHDLGFMFVPSAIKGWQLEGREDYRLAAMRAAKALAGQYNPDGGFIPGWGFFGGEDWSGNVLVDTLMNLPLIVWSVQQGGDRAMLDVVRSHAEKNLRHVMRKDGSVYHMFRFSPADGTPIAGDTYQGHGPETTWTRGQAWAIGGLAMLAQMLNDTQYLEASERAAAYFLQHLPDDGVPPWDFQAPADLPYKDAAAGAIAAFGFIKLFDATGNREHLDVAIRLLSALAETCANTGEEGGLLLHSTADLPHGLGIDESVMYGDYYYLKALMRLQQRLSGSPSQSLR